MRMPRSAGYWWKPRLACPSTTLRAVPLPETSSGRIEVCNSDQRPAKAPRVMADAPDNTKPDYRSTVFLPRTDFPMKAGLPQKEPGIAERWESEGLYQQIRKSREGREKFIF